jgi:hypothetical protein
LRSSACKRASKSFGQMALEKKCLPFLPRDNDAQGTSSGTISTFNNTAKTDGAANAVPLEPSAVLDGLQSDAALEAISELH